MDILAIALIVLAVVALSGWGYGTYAYRPAAPAGGAVVETGPAWANPLGVIGLLVVVGLVIAFLSGWRPFVVVGP